QGKRWGATLRAIWAAKLASASVKWGSRRAFDQALEKSLGFASATATVWTSGAWETAAASPLGE
ncbi:MAG: hypothetical protein ACRD4A_05300, partial [Candidatus Acidiferrales bacterium]